MAGQTFNHNGFVYEVQADGSARKVARAEQAIPANPVKMREAEVGIYNTQTNARGNEIDNSIKAATRDAIVRKANADAAAAEAEAATKTRTLTATPVMSEEQRKGAVQIGNLDAIVEQVNRVQELYDKGQKGFGFLNLGSLGEYLPSATNAQFNAAAAGLAEQGQAAFRIPGAGTSTDQDAQRFVEANQPSTYSFDSANEERLRQLRMRATNVRRQLGLPDAKWRQPGFDANDPNQALAVGYRDLRLQMEGKTPAQRQAMLNAFNNDPRIQSIKQRAGFRDPGGRAATASPPRRAGNVIRYDAQGNRI